MPSYKNYLDEEEQDIIRQERGAHLKLRKSKSRGQVKCHECSGTGKNNRGNLCFYCQGVGLLKN